MSTNTIETEKTTTQEAATPHPKPKHSAAKKAKPVRNSGQAKKPAGKPAVEASNKKAEVIAMMKRAKRATLADTVETTGVAEAHRPGLRQHPGRQGWRQDRVVAERRRGA